MRKQQNIFGSLLKICYSNWWQMISLNSSKLISVKYLSKMLWNKQISKVFIKKMRPIAYSRIVILSTKSNIILRSLLAQKFAMQLGWGPLQRSVCDDSQSKWDGPASGQRASATFWRMWGTAELSQQERFFYYLSFSKNTHTQISAFFQFYLSFEIF